MIGWTAFGQSRGQVRTPEESAVLSIDGVPVSADEYGRWMIDCFASRMARSFSEQYVVSRAAAEAGVVLAPGAVDTQIDSDVAVRVANAFRGERENWLDELRRTGWSETGHRLYRRTELTPFMLATEMTRRDRVVPEELIVRDWQLFYGPQGKEYTLSAIFVRVEVETPEAAPKEVYDAGRRMTFARGLAKALDIRERIVSGADFASLARELSDDETTRGNGGRIQAQFRPPGWNEPFVQSILALGPGAVSMPLFAKGGYWIVRVESVVETPLEAVRDEIERRLIELGPEQFEVWGTWTRVTANMQLEVLPELFEGVASPEKNDDVIGMRINGEPVPRSVFATWLLSARGEHHARDFAEHWCVERRAKELGLTATPADVQARLAEFQQWMIDQSYKGSRDAWLAYLRQSGRDEIGWRREWERRMRIDVLCEKILKAERVITEEQVVARWQQIYGREGKWIETRWILIGVEPPLLREDMTRESLDRAIAAQYEFAREQALGVLRRLKDGEDFGALARSASTDAATKDRGGRVPGRFRPDEWPAAVSEAVMKLRVGETSDVLDTGRGFAIFEVLSQRAVPYEEVKDEIHAELAAERPAQGDLNGVRNVLYNRAKVEVKPAMFGER